jgi:hypothetical protein
MEIKTNFSVGDHVFSEFYRMRGVVLGVKVEANVLKTYIFYDVDLYTLGSKETLRRWCEQSDLTHITESVS